MRKLFQVLLILAFLIFILILPIYFNDLGQKLSETDTIINLLKVFLPTSALVTALFTLYSKDDRLRANSENVLISLIFFLISNISVATALLLASLNSPPIARRIASALTYISLLVYASAFVFLMFGVFLRSYNEIYNLRTNKVWKYFKPIRKVKRFFRPYKPYNIDVERRKVDENSFSGIRGLFSETEINQISDGASILLIGFLTSESINLILDLVNERLNAEETVNYISVTRHPWEVWSILKNRHATVKGKQKDIVFIDAFTQTFAFNDDIHEENDRKLKADGVEYVKAKHFAGLHTSVAKAFNIIKGFEQEKGRGIRRPMLVVYEYTSTLCDFESVEQHRIFWRHVIPSERSYKMITLILEDSLVKEEILNSLKQQVDFILQYERGEKDELKLSRLK